MCIRDRYSDTALATNSRDGKIYASSMEGQVIGYFYNKDLFKQAGITEPAKTWDEFFQQCDKLKAAGITPLSMDTACLLYTSIGLVVVMICVLVFAPVVTAGIYFIHTVSGQLQHTASETVSMYLNEFTDRTDRMMENLDLGERFAAAHHLLGGAV